MNKLIKFLENPEKERKAKFVGFIAALCALFVSITPPKIIEAKTALAIIQLFWLVLLTISLTSIFFDFVGYIREEEKTINKKYNLPFNFIFSSSLGLILALVVLNLWRYILALYTEIIAEFMVLYGFPFSIMIGCVVGAILLKKYEGKIYSIFEILADSIFTGILFSIFGFYAQEAFTKLFYPYWFFSVAPITSIGFFVLFVILAIYRKQKLFS